MPASTSWIRCCSTMTRFDGIIDPFIVAWHLAKLWVVNA